MAKFNSVLIIILMLSLHSVKSQNYIPTLEEGKKYKIRFEQGMTSGFDYFPTITCDTIVRNGMVYNFVDCGLPNCSDIYIREDIVQEKLYYIEPIVSDKEILFLDYQLSIGDSIQYYIDKKVAVDTVFQQYIFGADRKTIGLGPGLFLIEGIGSSFEGPYPATYGYKYVVNTEIVDCGSLVSNLIDIEESIENIKIGPNPVSTDLYIQIEMKNQSSSRCRLNLYDINGKLIKKAILFERIFRLDFSEEEPGTYILELVVREKRNVQRIIKIP